jgi:hypothetical protein
MHVYRFLLGYGSGWSGYLEGRCFLEADALNQMYSYTTFDLENDVILFFKTFSISPK